MRHAHVAALLMLCLTSLARGGDGQDSGNQDDQRNLKVFDAKGHYVGPLVGYAQDTVATVIVANHATVVVPLSRTTNANDEFSVSQYQWGNEVDSFPSYLSTDCSGPPIIVGATPVRPSLTLRVGAVATVYIAPDSDSSTLTAHSYGPPGASCFTLGSSPSVPPVTPGEGWTPESTYPLTQNYPEPLSVHY